MTRASKHQAEECFQVRGRRKKGEWGAVIYWRKLHNDKKKKIDTSVSGLGAPTESEAVFLLGAPPAR